EGAGDVRVPLVRAAGVAGVVGTVQRRRDGVVPVAVIAVTILLIRVGAAGADRALGAVAGHVIAVTRVVGFEAVAGTPAVREFQVGAGRVGVADRRERIHGGIVEAGKLPIEVVLLDVRERVYQPASLVGLAGGEGVFGQLPSPRWKEAERVVIRVAGQAELL